MVHSMKKLCSINVRLSETEYQFIHEFTKQHNDLDKSELIRMAVKFFITMSRKKGMITIIKELMEEK